MNSAPRQRYIIGLVLYVRLFATRQNRKKINAGKMNKDRVHSDKIAYIFHNLYGTAGEKKYKI